MKQLSRRILAAFGVHRAAHPGEASRFTKNAEKRLRAAGWFPNRNVPLLNSSARSEEVLSAVTILREFGNLSLLAAPQDALVFGPHFASDAETDIPGRVISDDDRRVANLTWQFVSQRIGSDVTNVAWEQGQDEHAIAVDWEGRVYSATWRQLPDSRTAEVAVMKIADSIVAWLNYWLDPHRKTRDDLHAVFPLWSEETTIAI